MVMEDILMLYYEINNIYLELYRMELNGYKNTDSFIELIDLLKEKLEEEKSLYRELCEYISDCEYDNLCQIDDIVDTPFAKRIGDYMRFYNDLDLDISEEDDDETKNKKINTVNYAKLYVACTRNVYLVYLSFLQDYIDDMEYVSLRKGLLSYKYYNSFICHDVEYTNIMNKFSVERDNYINLNLIARTLRLNQKEVDEIIFECLEDTVMETIKKILSINDLEYNNEDRMVVSINTQCMLRAGLSMLSENEYDILKDKIYNLINRLSNDSNIMSVDIIKVIIDNRKKNKSRIKKLSFMFDYE